MKTISFVIEKDFINSSGDLKKAYLNGCKFVAKKMLNNKELKNKLVYRFTKVSETTITLTVYCVLDIEKEKENNCKICKEFHKSFFINEKYNCNSCNINSFLKKISEKEMISKSFYKEKILK